MIKIIAGSAISILVGSVLWGIIYEVMIVKGAVLTGSIFLGFIVALIFFALLMIYRESLVKSGKGSLVGQKIMQATDTEKLLQKSSAASMSSVTERTTDLLRAEKRDEGAESSRPGRAR